MSYIGVPPFGQTARALATYTALNGQTTFYPYGGYSVSHIDVYVNGLRMVNNADYIANDGLSVIFTSGLVEGDIVEIVTYGTISFADSVRRSGDTLNGTYYTQDIVPSANITYNIGSATSQYNTIYAHNAVVSGSVTSNAATAFIAGPAAISGVALEIPREGGIRNMYNGVNNMYFDVSNGGTSHGAFVFRGSSAFTEYAIISNSGIKATTSYVGKTPFNSALDATVTVDSLKFRISNQSGVFPQVGNASGTNVDLCWSTTATVSGGSVSSQNSGTIVSAGAWVSVYTDHGMDSRGDTVVAHVTEKNAGKVYRVTFLVTNDSNNTTGYNIVVERLI